MVHSLSGQRKTFAKSTAENPDDRGPMKEYNARVASGQLRDDEHQRGQQHIYVFILCNKV